MRSGKPNQGNRTMNLQTALSELGDSVRAHETEIGNEVWAALEAAGLARYARISVGVDARRSLPAPDIIKTKPKQRRRPTPKKGKAKPKKAKPKTRNVVNRSRSAKGDGADIKAVKKMIRMGGAKTAFVESILEEGPQPVYLLLDKAREGMVEAGVLAVTRAGGGDPVADLTDLGRRWAKSCGIPAADDDADG